MRGTLVGTLLLLLIDGLLAWALMASPIVLVCLFVLAGVHMAFLVFNPQGLRTSIFISMVSIVLASLLGVVQFEPLASFAMGAIVLAHYFAWSHVEMESGKDERLKTGRVPFLVGMYGSFLEIFLLLRGFFPFSIELSTVIGFVILALSLFVCEFGGVRGLHRGERSGRVDAGSWITRIAVLIMALVCGGVLFFAGQEPVDRVTKSIELWVNEKRFPSGEKEEDEIEPFGGYDTESEMAIGEGRAHSLPDRADFIPKNDLDFCMKINDPTVLPKWLKRPNYLRGSVYCVYQNQAWQTRSEDKKWIADASDGLKDGAVMVQLYPEPGIPHSIYALRTMDTLPALQRVSKYHLSKVFRYDVDWYREPDLMAEGFSYDAVSSPLGVLDLKGSPAIGAPGPEYLQLPETELMEQIKALVQAIPGIERAGPLEKIDALKRFFENEFEYSLKIENANSLPPLENFLFVEQRGYCDFFATSGTLMARALGIPSRMCLGHCGGRFFPRGGIFEFRRKHYHAWTEVYFEKYGWVTVDFTPEGQGAAQRPAQASLRERSVGMEAFRKVEINSGGGSWFKRRSMQWASQLGLPALGPWPSILLGVLLVLCLGVILARLFKRPAKDTFLAAEPTPPSLPDYVTMFVNFWTEQGYPKTQGQTLREYVAGLQVAEGNGEGFTELQRYFYATQYEDAQRDPQKEKQFEKMIKAFPYPAGD